MNNHSHEDFVKNQHKSYPSSVSVTVVNLLGALIMLVGVGFLFYLNPAKAMAGVGFGISVGALVYLLKDVLSKEKYAWIRYLLTALIVFVGIYLFWLQLLILILVLVVSVPLIMYGDQAHH